MSLTCDGCGRIRQGHLDTPKMFRRTGGVDILCDRCRGCVDPVGMFAWNLLSGADAEDDGPPDPPEPEMREPTCAEINRAANRVLDKYGDQRSHLMSAKAKAREAERKFTAVPKGKPGRPPAPPAGGEKTVCEKLLEIKPMLDGLFPYGFVIAASGPGGVHCLRHDNWATAIGLAHLLLRSVSHVHQPTDEQP